MKREKRERLTAVVIALITRYRVGDLVTHEQIETEIGLKRSEWPYRPIVKSARDRLVEDYKIWARRERNLGFRVVSLVPPLASITYSLAELEKGIRPLREWIRFAWRSRNHLSKDVRKKVVYERAREFIKSIREMEKFRESLLEKQREITQSE